MQAIPKEILLNLFHFSPIMELTEYKKVCRLWQKIITESPLQEKLIIEFNRFNKSSIIEKFDELQDLKTFAIAKNTILLALGIRNLNNFITIEECSIDHFSIKNPKKLTRVKEEINYIDSAADWIILGFSNGKISVFKNETSWKVEEFVIGADDKVLYSILQDGIYYCHTKQRVWKYNTFSNQLDVHIDQKLSSFHIDSDYEYLGSQYSNFLVSSRKIIKQEKIPLKSTFSHITSSQLYLFLVSSSGVSALVKNDWTLKTTLKSCNFKKESTNCKASFVFINKKKRCFTFCSNHHLNVYNAQTLEFEFLNICKDPQIQSHPYILKAAITKNTLIYQTYDNLYKVSFDSTIEQIKKT